MQVTFSFLKYQYQCVTCISWYKTVRVKIYARERKGRKNKNEKQMRVIGGCIALFTNAPKYLK